MNFYTVQFDQCTVTIIARNDYEASVSAFLYAHPVIDIPICAWYRGDTHILDIKKNKDDKHVIDSAIIVNRTPVAWSPLRGRFIYMSGPKKDKAAPSATTLTI